MVVALVVRVVLVEAQAEQLLVQAMLLLLQQLPILVVDRAEHIVEAQRNMQQVMAEAVL